MITAMRPARPAAIQTPNGAPKTRWDGSIRSLMGLGGALTVWLPESHLAMPRAMPIMPSVTMNGTIRSQPMTNPLIVPIPAPTAIVRPAAVAGEQPLASDVAPTTLVRATTEPTLKSIPPLTMMTVMPSAPMATITVWVKMILKFAPLRKYGRTVGLSENKPITSSKPRKGPRRLKSRFAGVGRLGGAMPDPKLQTPSSKSQKNPKLQIPKPASPKRNLELGIWSFFGAWNLEFGVGVPSFQILVQRRIKQFLDARLVHVLRGHQHDPGINSFFNFFALQMLDRCDHSQVAHQHRVLHHHGLKVPVLHIQNRLRTGIEPDHFHLAPRQPDVSQSFGHGDRGRFVCAKDAVDLAPEPVQQILRDLVGSLARGARVLVRGNDFHVGILRSEHVEKSGLARLGARRADRVPKQDQVALSVEQLAHLFPRQLAALVIVRCHKADVSVGLEVRVHDDDWDLGLEGIVHGFDQRLRIQRRQHYGAHAAHHEILHNLNLLVAVVFAQRAFPDDVHFGSLPGQLALGLDRPRMDRFPKLVCRALGNDSDRVSRLSPDGEPQPAQAERDNCNALATFWHEVIL